jgi:type I restriction enzyme S subunit
VGLRPGYKLTEVGVIPEDWNAGHLGEKTRKVGSGITPRGGEKVYMSEGRPFLRSQNVGWGSLILEDIAFIDDETHETFKATEVEVDDVFLNITGASIGRSAVADARVAGGNVNQHVCIIRANQEQLDPRFLNCFLLSNSGQRQIDSFQAGGNRQGLNFGQIRSFQLPIPPIPEQRAIAAALSDVDALTGALDRLIVKKRDLKQAAMQQLLTGKRRLPGFQGEWKVKTVSAIGDVITGGTPSTAVREYWGGDIPWVTPTDISDAKDIVETERKITARGLESIRALPKDSVLVTCIASIGKNAILRFRGGCNQQINAVVPHETNCAEFLYYLFEQSKQYLLAYAGRTATSIVSKADFSVLEFRIPELPEQTAIAAVLSDMDAEIEALGRRRDKTSALKQGMMQELLTGRIRLA